jgi:16S rRNA (uracil1498-N3)-methyltransferase
MHRFHIPPDKCTGARLTLGDGETHHATRVLRIQEGETVEVLDGRGLRLRCRVAGLRKSRVELEALSREFTPRPGLPITLLCGIPKGQLFDEIVEQATELGAARIVPLMTERSNVRFDPAAGAAKRDKWQGTATEAIKQCGGAWIPEVETPRSLPAALTPPAADELAMVASLHPGAVEVREAVAPHAVIGAPFGRVSIWVGPEGDFSASEIEQLRAVGIRPVTLGPLVLRCRTAALALLAIVTHELRVTRPGA